MDFVLWNVLYTCFDHVCALCILLNDGSEFNDGCKEEQEKKDEKKKT